MRMAVDQARKNRHGARIEPVNRSRPVYSAQIVVITYRGDVAVFNNDRAPLPSAEGAKLRGIDNEPADAKKILLHSPCL